jgi:hypothetical protein
MMEEDFFLVLIDRIGLGCRQSTELGLEDLDSNDHILVPDF